MTAHNIKTPGLCFVSGKHLSEAPNSATFAKIDAECQADARAILRNKRAEQLQMDRPTELDRATWRAER